MRALSRVTYLSGNTPMTTISTRMKRFDDGSINASQVDVLILAAGFEERAFAYLERASFSKDAICLLVGYDNSISKNAEIFEKFKGRAKETFGSENVYTEFLKFNEFSEFFGALRQWVLTVPRVRTH